MCLQAFADESSFLSPLKCRRGSEKTGIANAVPASLKSEGMTEYLRAETSIQVVTGLDFMLTALRWTLIISGSNWLRVR